MAYDSRNTLPQALPSAMPAPSNAASKTRFGLRRGTLILYLLLAPTLVGMILFQYYPAIQALFYSFTNWNGRNSDFIGLANFKYFISDPKLLTSFGNLLQLLVANLLKTLTVPLLVAYCLAHVDDRRLSYVYRVLFVLPVVIPGFVATLFWRWVLALDGILNFILRSVGLPELAHAWLGEAATALYALMFIGFPWVPAVTMLIYLAGFMSISNDILDAAVVDGASLFRRFWHIELPQVMGQIKLLVILTTIATIQDFWQILFLTDGGPGYATTLVPGLAMYKAAMTLPYRFGYASAIGFVLFVIILILTLLNQRFIRGPEEEVAKGVL